MLQPKDIPDSNVREWFISRESNSVIWLKTESLLDSKLTSLFEVGYREYKRKIPLSQNSYVKWIKSLANNPTSLSCYCRWSDERIYKAALARFELIDDMKLNGFDKAHLLALHKFQFNDKNRQRALDKHGNLVEFDVYDGHHRVAAAYMAGIEFVPACYQDFPRRTFDQLESISRRQGWIWYQPIDFGQSPPALNIVHPNTNLHGEKKYDFILKKHLLPIKGKRFIDFGCNSGVISACIARDGAETVWGLDYPDVVEQAWWLQDTLWVDYGNLLFRGLDLRDLNKTSQMLKSIGQVDCMLMANFIYYLGDKVDDFLELCMGFADKFIIQGNSLKHDERDKPNKRIKSQPNYRGEYATVDGMIALLAKHGLITDVDAPDKYSKPVVTGKKRSAPTCIYIGTPGLGEMVGQSPLWREINTRGYKVILVCREEISAAFEELPFIDEVWSLSQFDLFYERERVYLSEQILDRMRSQASIVVSAIPSKLRDIPGGLTRPDSEVVLQNKLSKTHNAVHSWARHASIAISNDVMEIGFSRTETPVDENQFNVAICVGSFDHSRRLSPDVIERICKRLPHQTRIYLLGPWENEVDLNIPSNVNRELLMPRATMSKNSMRLNLSYLEKMDVVISTDTGLMYCAVALDKPTLCLESRTLITALLPPYVANTQIVRPDPQTLRCLQDCHARKILKLLKKEGKETNEWQPLAIRHRIAPSGELDCKKNDKLSVECLRNLDIDAVCNFVLKHMSFNSDRPEVMCLGEPSKTVAVKLTHVKVDDAFENQWSNVHAIAKNLVSFATAGDGGGFTCIGQNKKEIYQFLKILQSLNLEIGMEIGCWYGGSHYLLQSVVPTMLSMDIDYGRLVLAKMLCSSDRSHFIHANSNGPGNVTVVREKLRELGYDCLDLLFIDGNHSYEPCKKDHDLYSGLVREGGVIAFHDYRSFPGVTKCVDELTGVNITILDDSTGIAYYIK